MSRGVRVLAASVTLSVLMTACGIGSTGAVEEIERDDLAALDQTSTTSTTVPATSEPPDTTPETGPPASPGSVVETAAGATTTIAETTTTIETEDVELYFINGSQLVPVDVAVPAGSLLRGQLRGLEVGPPPGENDEGVRTAVPAGLISGVKIRGERVTVDIDSELFATVESQDQRHMVAQIVLSLTGSLGYRDVRFTLDGAPMQVFRRDELLSGPGEPVTWEDYAALLEEQSDDEPAVPGAATVASAATTASSPAPASAGTGSTSP